MTWKSEIEDLHDFFVEWFSGRAAESDFQRFEDSLEPSFTMIVPSGEERTRAETLAMVKSAHGVNDTPIETKNHRLLAETDKYLVARYEEWHNGTKGRVSTVVFRKRDQGLGWLTVQETWL